MGGEIKMSSKFDNKKNNKTNYNKPKQKVTVKPVMEEEVVAAVEEVKPVAKKAPEYPKSWKVNTGRLNMRSKASLEGDVITQLVIGEEVKVVEEVDGDWSSVLTKDGRKGFVMSRFLKRG